MNTFAVTVTYGNRYHLVKQVIDSALAEGVAKVIVVDNNSVPQSREQLKAYEQEHGILGLVSMNYKKDFSRFIIAIGIFNITFCFAMVYLYPEYGASISMIASEIVLLVLIMLKILKIKQQLRNCYE